jgi:DNA-binding LytR/AlgR family response regulator
VAEASSRNAGDQSLIMNMSYTCIIVDDEPLAHTVIRNYLSAHTDIDIVGNFYNAVDARAYLQGNRVDLMFLDIQMPEVTGVTFLKALENKPVTIFTTAFRKYALEGFDLGVVDFLLKPIAQERFEQALDRALKLMEISKKPVQQFLEIKEGTEAMMVDVNDIIYLQGLKDYSVIFTAAKKYMVLGSLKNYETRLPQDRFLRVHKSFIVNLDHFKSVKQQKIYLDHGTVSIGRSYKEVVESKIAKFFGT